MFKTLSDLRKLFTHPSIFKQSKMDKGESIDFGEDCLEETAFKIEFSKGLIRKCVSKK